MPDHWPTLGSLSDPGGVVLPPTSWARPRLRLRAPESSPALAFLPSQEANRQGVSPNTEALISPALRPRTTGSELQMLPEHEGFCRELRSQRGIKQLNGKGGKTGERHHFALKRFALANSACGGGQGTCMAGGWFPLYALIEKVLHLWLRCSVNRYPRSPAGTVLWQVPPKGTRRGAPLPARPRPGVGHFLDCVRVRLLHQAAAPAGTLTTSPWTVKVKRGSGPLGHPPVSSGQDLLPLH